MIGVENIEHVKCLILGSGPAGYTAAIIATGAVAKYLGLPSESKFRGMGVSAKPQ